MPNFINVNYKLGLPCVNCGLPTGGILISECVCDRCGFRKVVDYSKMNKKEEATYCNFCNP